MEVVSRYFQTRVIEMSTNLMALRFFYLNSHAKVRNRVLVFSLKLALVNRIYITVRS